VEPPHGFPMCAKSGTVVVIRSGGLGDFVLTLPFVRELGRRFADVALVTRASHWKIIERDGFASQCVDVDSADFASLLGAPSSRMREVLAEASVFSFLPDPEQDLEAAARKCGARRFTTLDAKPRTPPHVARRMFIQADMPAPERLLEVSCLERQTTGDRLWLHPGSGSPAKNAPLEIFVRHARRWGEETGLGLTVSFGEADLHLVEPMRRLLEGLPCRFEVTPDPLELRTKLEEQGARFVGNDSGVTHLAAALGLPTEVYFVSTDPEIWAPLGKRVTVTRRHRPGAAGQAPEDAGTAPENAVRAPENAG